MSTRGFAANREKASMAGKIGGRMSKRGYGKPGKILEENELYIRNELIKGRYLNNVAAELGVSGLTARIWAQKRGIEYRRRKIKKTSIKKLSDMKKEMK